MAKLKRLLPTLRERKRYVVFQILSEKQISDAEHVRQAIEQALFNYVGTKGVRQAGLMFLKDKYQKNQGTVRINHKMVDEFKASMMHITHIDDQEVALKSVITSGTMKKAARGGENATNATPVNGI